MKEYLDNEGVCFGVDCLRSYSEIRKLTQSSIRACEQLLHVVQSRVKAEQVHSASLADIAQMPLVYAPGSLQECMEQLQSDTNHKASQHKILADSLVEEVIRPITLLKDQMAKKEVVLYGQYTNMSTELKKLEDSYTKKSIQFTKAYKSAMTNISLCRKHGISNDEYNQVTNIAAAEPQANKSLSNTWNSLTSLTSNTNLLATKEKGKDLLNWVVASASGTPTGTPIPAVLTPSTPIIDKKEQCLITMRCLDKLEKYRIVARKAWLDYVVVSQRYAIKTQILLTKLQGMQESFILILQDHLRKIIVVESSFLANQQYDIQMLFKVMEEIDVKEDMRQFILKNASTPLDLYQSDDEGDEEEEEEEGIISICRDRSTSNEIDEHDIEISFDRGGKPISCPKKPTSKQENIKDVWSNNSWTSDIFPKSLNLSHVKTLPLPPNSDVLTFSHLKTVLIDSHLDQLDERSTSTWDQHQYIGVDKVSEMCRLSLVSRHIEKHNSLVGEGQAGSLARLEIVPTPISTRKRRSQDMKSLDSPSSRVSVTKTASDGDSRDTNGPVNHPLTTSEADLLSSPLSNTQLNLMDESISNQNGTNSGDNCDHESDEEDEDEDEELMSYGTAEEAIEKMVILQTRMRVQWASLIREFSENVLDDAEKTSDNTTSSGSTIENKNKKADLIRGDGVSEEKGVQLLYDQINGHGDIISSNGHSSEKLDQLDDSNMLSRSLKDAENDVSENVDSVKCREIMNSFGLLDAVSVDVEDNWHHDRSTGVANSGVVNSADSIGSNDAGGEGQLSTSFNISPQAVQDMAMSTPVMRNKPFSLPDGGLDMPFLATTKSDFSDQSDNAMTNSTLTVTTPFTDQAVGSSVDDRTLKYSMNHFGSATPESLDFLSS